MRPETLKSQPLNPKTLDPKPDTLDKVSAHDILDRGAPAYRTQEHNADVLGARPETLKFQPLKPKTLDNTGTPWTR